VRSHLALRPRIRVDRGSRQNGIGGETKQCRPAEFRRKPGRQRSGRGGDVCVSAIAR
jgi:hypothetical protein